MRLERVEPERALAWRSEDGNSVWTFVLDERDGRTPPQPQPLPAADARVASRDDPDGARLAPMERKLLYGIEQRAERLGALH